jgi:hypothetical protein
VLAGELRMRPVVAHCHLGLGRRGRRAGAARPTQKHLTAAMTMYGEMGMPYWLERAEAQRPKRDRIAPPLLVVRAERERRATRRHRDVSSTCAAVIVDPAGLRPCGRR